MDHVSDNLKGFISCGLTILDMKTELRPFWNRLFEFNGSFGLALILAVCIPRFALVLSANMTGNYSGISVIMVISAMAPFLFLSRHGRRSIGITKPANYPWTFYSFLLGALFSALLFAFGYVLYSDTSSNWYVYIAQSYQVFGAALSDQDKFIYFIIYAVIGMTFSPIGEEFFFRGIVHGSFAKHSGEKKASIIDSLAFALTHLAHFGIVFISGTWKFLFIPALLWVAAMFIASRIFFYCKQKSGAVYGAVSCHAGFNLGMTYFIFYFLMG
jgi:hypothetical protein